MEYVITAEYPTGRHIVVIAGKNIEKAKLILTSMQTNPTEDDLYLIGDGKNLMIEKVEDKDCW